MMLAKREIHELTARQLCSRITELKFDEEVGTIDVVGMKELLAFEKEMKSRLVKLLGRDFYPPEPEVKFKPGPEPELEPKPVFGYTGEVKAKSTIEDAKGRTQKTKSKLEPAPGPKIRFNVVVTSQFGVKAAEFGVDTTTRKEADREALKKIRKLGLKGAAYKIC